MKRRGKKIMLIAIGFILIISGILFVFFNIPYSKTKTEFDTNVNSLIAEEKYTQNLFIEKDIANLPLPVQRYFRYCGYVETPKYSYMKIYYQDVKFRFNKNDSVIKIDYTQYNFSGKPNRIAYIKSTKYGIPFEGLDTFLYGKGSMRGVLAKLITLFNQTGTAMDKSSLVTFLSEVLFIPNAALQNYIKWEEIDNYHAKATISFYDISASGIFTFNEKGEMVCFATDDRFAIANDGSADAVKWSITCNNYEEINGIKKPTVFKAIWHYDDDELIYFDGKGTITNY